MVWSPYAVGCELSASFRLDDISIDRMLYGATGLAFVIFMIIPPDEEDEMIGWKWNGCISQSFEVIADQAVRVKCDWPVLNFDLVWYFMYEIAHKHYTLFTSVAAWCVVMYRKLKAYLGSELETVALFWKLGGKSSLREKMYTSSKNSKLHPHILLVRFCSWLNRNNNFI